jgi:hypothetical protein
MLDSPVNTFPFRRPDHFNRQRISIFGPRRQIEEIDHYACHKRPDRFESRVNHIAGDFVKADVS